MTDRFTQKARTALNRAMSCARELGHTYIGSEHLLLGLAGESGSIAEHMLASRGGDYDRLYAAVAQWAGTGTPSHLSARDMTKVCMLVRLGFPPFEIGYLLHLSPQHVSNVRSKINQKLFHQSGAKGLNEKLCQI